MMLAVALPLTKEDKKVLSRLNLPGLVLSLALGLTASAAHAGPIIIAGTDADDHGSFSAGANRTGWKFMQQAFSQLGGNITNGKKSIVCVGCNGSDASAAFTSSTALAGLTGFTFQTVTSTADITAYFAGTGSTTISNTGILYMPTVAGNIAGGISDAQLAVVNANGSTINSFVTAGGGLFTQEQANSTIGYGWLQSLLPGFKSNGDNTTGVFDDGTLQLTAQGTAQFPALTNTDISNATPWHAYFTGNLGALQTLIVGNGDGVGGFNDPVVLGGGFAGGGGTIIIDPPVGVPEPASMALIACGLVGLAVTRRRRAM